MFARGSRYERVEGALHTDASGRSIPYKLLRTIPDPPPRLVVAVAAGDRLDLLADRHFGDPEQFWRICDANRAHLPRDLLVPVGRRLVIPQQVP